MIIVAALYAFLPVTDPAAVRARVAAAFEPLGLRGTLLVAPEGLNGTIAGTREAIDAAKTVLAGIAGDTPLSWKESQTEAMPFGRLKVRLKREIVTMGQPDVDPRASVGRHVAAEEWNDVIRDPGTVVIDTRNAYEVAIGSFDGAVDPQTEAFGDFPDWWAENADRFAGKRVAMFCTGGIRCEKSTSYLIRQGVEDVVHLDGGILKYLETVPEEESLWHGGCFVFDQRVAVGHGLEPTGHLLCYGCRKPLETGDTQHPDYEEGVACHRCAHVTSEADKGRYRERHLQRVRAR
ncbi:rhodanese-related sulfurtransferase [Aestuariibius insulae]|uniref:oxygen-dependent tRNA uridine(34) hydroxylase TrhO n=1 Tax=Aestuariibius insulae TaxID=2058287 RepID=UPI00345E2F2D